MEEFSVERTPEGLQIMGFPDAVAAIPLRGAEGQRLAGLALHRTDVEFAIECLKSVNAAGGAATVVARALWSSAIVHFMKCFGKSAARFSLDPEVVFDNDPLGLEVFAYFKSLRNKHLVHDENAYAQSIPLAIVNSSEHEYKIAKIITMSVVSGTLEQANYSNLMHSCEVTLRWINQEFDILADEVTQELEVQEHSTLLARGSVQYQVATVDEVHKRRKNH